MESRGSEIANSTDFSHAVQVVHLYFLLLQAGEVKSGT